MEIRYKHNKKRNTAILYEMIIREFTAASLKEDFKKMKIIKKILKEYFSRGTILGEELQLYKILYETRNAKDNIARQILEQVKQKHEKYSYKYLYEIQKKLIEDTKIALGENIFSHFIPNYRTLATISQIFNDKVDIQSKIALEQKILESMCSKDEEDVNRLQPLDTLSFRKAVEKFNNKYSASLNESQKTLLQYCVFSEIDEGVSLKNFINKEMNRILPVVEKLEYKEKNNAEILESISNIKHKILDFSGKSLKEDDIAFVLKMQKIAEEAE